MIIINLLKILIMNMSTFWRQQRIDKIGIYFMLQQEYSFIMPVRKQNNYKIHVGYTRNSNVALFTDYYVSSR
jgi:hypothetical protein